MFITKIYVHVKSEKTFLFTLIVINIYYSLKQSLSVSFKLFPLMS